MTPSVTPPSSERCPVCLSFGGPPNASDVEHHALLAASEASLKEAVRLLLIAEPDLDGFHTTAKFDKDLEAFLQRHKL